MTFGEPETLDPLMNYETAGGGILFNVYEGLVSFDGKDPAKFKPVLAESIPDPVKTDDGGVTYTWNIKKGIKFHEGQELTPEDIAYSFWRMMLNGSPDTPAFLLTEPFLGQGIIDVTLLIDETGALEGDAEALAQADPAELEAACQTVKDAIQFDNDAGTVTMKLKQPWGPFIATIAQRWASAMNKEWTAGLGEWDGDCATWHKFYATPNESRPTYNQTNGTGPYKVDHWTPGEEFVLVAFDGHRNGTPKITRQVMKYVGEFGTRFASLQAGDADAIAVGSAADWAQMDTLVREECNADTGECKEVNPDGILRVIKPLLSLSRTDIGMNQNIAEGSPFVGSGKLDGEGVPLNFFSDVHIRRAFNYCFDYETYIEQVQFGEATRSLALTLPGQLGYDGTPIYEYDLAKCEEEFKASTITGTLADGSVGNVWDTGFYLQLGYNSGNTAREAMAQILADGLSQVNSKFIVVPNQLPWPTYLRTLRAGQLATAAAGWQEDIHDPHNWYVPYFLTTYGSRFNISQELLDKYTPLINAGAIETDDAKRAEIYTELNQMIHEDAPYVILSVSNGRRYEQLYMNGWLGGTSQNPLVSSPGAIDELSKDNVAK